MKKTLLRSIHSGRESHFGSAVLIEPMEPRTLMSATPTVSLKASVATASAVSPVTEGRFTFTRTGSTAKSLVVYYHVAASSTISSHQYQKLSGSVTIAAGKNHAYVKVIPTTVITVSTDPVLTLVTAAYKRYARGTHIASVTVIEQHNVTVTSQRFFAPITVAANGFTRTNEPVDQTINLTTILSGLSQSGSVLDSSLKVVETNADGSQVLDGNVPFQLDKAANYVAATNAAGNVVLQMSGTTTANQTRYYRVYFDTQGSYTAPTFTSQVSVTSGNDAVGLDSYKIANGTATYVMQKSTGGISAIIDAQSNDWIGFNSSGGSAGQYRGAPNMGTNSGLHPYDPNGNFPSSGAQDSVNTTIINSGPLKTTIDVAAKDNTVDVTYEFYPTFVRVTVNKNTNGNYWFLYEGTPGGSFNTSDHYLLSDGSTNTLDQQFDATSGIGNSTVGQWAAFQSASENRFIYFAHNNVDSVDSSYYDLNNQMTVFGFGRTGINNGQSKAESGANTFTIGLADGNSTAANTINGQYRDLSVSLGTGQKIG